MEVPQQVPASELPSTSSSSATASATSSNVSYDKIVWTGGDITEAMSEEEPSTSQLRQIATDSATSSEANPSTTSYSFTGKDLKSSNASDTGSNSTGTTTSPEGAESKDKNAEQNEESLYECNICLDTAKDAVVSMCGHLFCWPCLHQWLLTRPNRKLCPVCKAAVDKDKVIPLYGRNSTRQEDPRNKVPPRPPGHRTEPEPAPGFPGFGFGDGFHMSFGIGAFPFGFITSSLNFGEPRPAGKQCPVIRRYRMTNGYKSFSLSPPAANRGTTQYEDEQTLSKLFLYLAFLCIGWLLFA
ncbi:hypothetical protein KR054_009977 [Drosophila jambulina]|nr:hypothetical protein KR054_009977 [Drosophila jambulina]